jgi:hypothetical protein
MLKANKQDAVLCDFAVETGFNQKYGQSCTDGLCAKNSRLD